MVDVVVGPVHRGVASCEYVFNNAVKYVWFLKFSNVFFLTLLFVCYNGKTNKEAKLIMHV